MAGTATLTSTSLVNTARRKLTRHAIACVSDASGNVSGNAKTVGTGLLRAVRFVPDGGGTQPTDQFDVTLKDSSGLDLLGGNGANRSNAATSGLQLDPPVLIDSTVDVGAANAGNAKGFTVQLLMEY